MNKITVDSVTPSLPAGVIGAVRLTAGRWPLHFRKSTLPWMAENLTITLGALLMMHVGDYLHGEPNTMCAFARLSCFASSRHLARCNLPRPWIAGWRDQQNAALRHRDSGEPMLPRGCGGATDPRVPQHH